MKAACCVLREEDGTVSNLGFIFADLFEKKNLQGSRRTPDVNRESSPRDVGWTVSRHVRDSISNFFNAALNALTTFGRLGFLAEKERQSFKPTLALPMISGANIPA